MRSPFTKPRTPAPRRLRYEPLEDRRLLAIIADTFADSFAQVTRITGQEATVLTADAAGQLIKQTVPACDQCGSRFHATVNSCFRSKN